MGADKEQSSQLLVDFAMNNEKSEMMMDDGAEETKNDMTEYFN